MLKEFPMTVEHDMSGKTVFPASCDCEVIERNGRIMARIVVNGIVFINPGPFRTRESARHFIYQTIREGATIS